MFGHFCKKELEILVSIKTVCLGCFRQTVNDGTGFGTFIGFGDYEIFPAYGKWPDRLFGIVVIHRDVTILQELTKVFLLVYAVCQGFAYGAVMAHLTI